MAIVTSAATSIPTSYSASSEQFTSAATNGYNNSSNTSTTNRAYCISRTDPHYTFYYFTITGIPSNATITSVTCIFRSRVYSARYPFNVQLCSGDVAKSNTVSVNKTTTQGDIYTLSGGSWTVNEIQALNLKIVHNTNASNRWMAFNGADLTITYEYDDSSGGSGVSTKENGVWNEASAVWKKINNTWVKQTNTQNIFTDSVYLKTDGTLFINKN